MAKTSKKGRVPARWQGPRDLRFFIANAELWFVVPGTIVLAFVEFQLYPSPSGLADFVQGWKWQIVLASLLLILLPPIVARGVQHLRTREGYNRRSGAQSFALESVRGRASYLIAKLRQVEAGERTNEYLVHTLSACNTYFRGRTFSGTETVDGRSARIDVAYFKRADATQTQMYKKLKTNDGSSAPWAVTVSSRQNETTRQLIATVNSGQTSLSPADFELWGSPFLSGDHTYVTGVGVPVFDSPKDDRQVVGLLLAISDDKAALHTSDHEYLETQGWMIAVAIAAERVALTTSGATGRPRHAVDVEIAGAPSSHQPGREGD
ncbi:hypothetical protein [Microbacterium sp. 22296]|uniref:hypothetical protein n=1 Tax=Microbacterium sp. 22296 TaxID=3453903 RepID=UPI003F87E9DF